MKHPLPPIVTDTREQTPFAFPPDVATIPGTLAAGDYSLQGFEELAAIERKSLPDLVACIGPERDRFTRELLRLRSYRCRALVIEASLQDILDHRYRSMTEPAAVIGSLASWGTRYDLPVILAGDAKGGAVYALAILRNFHRHLCEFAEKITGKAEGRNDAI